MTSTWSRTRTNDYLDGNDTPPLGLFGVFVLSLAIGVILSFVWVGNLRRVASAPRWPSVDGRVAAPSSTPRGKNSYKYDVIADVEYMVGGQKPEMFAMEIATGVSQADASSKLPKRGTVIQVWYDPADPERSTAVNVWSDSHTWQVWILVGCWGTVLATFPILCWRLKKASQGVLDGTD